VTDPAILHVDLDAFFAAVEQRDRPELRGRPVIVGGGGPTDRGVVSTCSYEARVFGVRSAMPLRTAAALCPDAVFVPVNGRRYLEVSRQVMAILGRYTPRIEQVSIDEAFLDVAGSESLFGSGESIARAIRGSIQAELGISASVGVASNRLVAKIASDLRKPDGLVVVPVGQEAVFLAPLPVERLWGVGPSAHKALADYGVATIGDLAALSPALLERRFGNQGAVIGERARGIDPTPIVPEAEAKSVSHEHTFDLDTSDTETIERTLLSLSEGVAQRLRDAGIAAGTVGVKVRTSDFETLSRQRTLKEPTDQADMVWRTALALARPEVRGREIRLLGVAASGLTERRQLTLFEGEAGVDEGREGRWRRTVLAMDEIRERFGIRSIVRARLLDDRVAAPFERDPRGLPRSRQADRGRPPRDRDRGA
jgi:DNA polymerase IV